MERIDYETYTRRAGTLRSQAIADFNRRIAKAVASGIASLANGLRAARRSVANPLKQCQAPGVRTC